MIRAALLPSRELAGLSLEEQSVFETAYHQSADPHANYDGGVRQPVHARAIASGRRAVAEMRARSTAEAKAQWCARFVEKIIRAEAKGDAKSVQLAEQLRASAADLGVTVPPRAPKPKPPAPPKPPYDRRDALTLSQLETLRRWEAEHAPAPQAAKKETETDTDDDDEPEERRRAAPIPPKRATAPKAPERPTHLLGVELLWPAARKPGRFVTLASGVSVWTEQ